jgi:small-conductance mechanosensitive channel
VKRAGCGRGAGALLAACLPVAVVASLASVTATAQVPPRDGPPASVSAEPSDHPFTVVFVNRPIATLRARVLGREPLERAEGVRRALDDLVGQRITEPIERRSFGGGVVITIASRGVLVLTPSDVDELSGETVDAAAARAVDAMRIALAEALEARTPAMLLREGGTAVLALIAGLLALYVIRRMHRILDRRLAIVAEQTVARTGIADVAMLRASRLLDVQHWAVAALTFTLNLAVAYATIGLVLRQFPFTRPWGESMRGFLLTTVQTLSLGIADAMPGLFTVAVIVAIARFVSRLIAFWFSAIERGHLTPRWIYPETAQPTRRLFIGLLWVFAGVVSYPYLPGSQTDAFKGISVFLGLMVTFGSSGLMNQIMSGFMITYSRALRVGDFVRIGEAVGTVTHLGVLSVKVTTLQHEDATIPNAVVVAQTTTDFSRFSETSGVLTPTTVTIGYDTPWRQVRSLMLRAAERTPGLRRDPAPRVIQEGLEDFFVKYTLLVCLDQQDSRLWTLDALHANIQDLFNEYGVQIMSPHYVIDPTAPKVVPREAWFAAPASGEVPGRDTAAT